MVERNLAKVEVESSRLFCRSRSHGGNRLPVSPVRASRPASFFSKVPAGGVAEWLCSGLQSRVRRFDSDPRLQTPSEGFLALLLLLWIWGLIVLRSDRSNDD